MEVTTFAERKRSENEIARDTQNIQVSFHCEIKCTLHIWWILFCCSFSFRKGKEFSTIFHRSKNDFLSSSLLICTNAKRLSSIFLHLQNGFWYEAIAREIALANLFSSLLWTAQKDARKFVDFPGCASTENEPTHFRGTLRISGSGWPLATQQNRFPSSALRSGHFAPLLRGFKETERKLWKC